MPRRIAILGSTGSIGQSALAVVEALADRLEVVGLAAGANAARLAEQVRRHRPRAISLESEASLREVWARLDAGDRERVEGFTGRDGLRAVATLEEADVVLCASAGTEALEAVLAAIQCGKTIALANKEVLVMAGHLVMDAARRHGVEVLPVDSEHNAIHQCVHGRANREIRRLILTASGGPFRQRPLEELASVGPSDALRHPTWKMGRKITVDSATLMNKGLEVIEAHWLFQVDGPRIDVVIHPQSVVHSMVELVDGSVIAQMGVTDMRLPIQYAFSYPDRWDAALPALDVLTCGPLEFEPPDPRRFPCLQLAYDALAEGGSFPVVLNAANEVAVGHFLEGRLPFLGIPSVIARALEGHRREGGAPSGNLAELRRVDEWARGFTTRLVRGVESEVRIRR